MTDETEHDRPLEVARYDAFISYAREDNTAAMGFVVDRLREVLSTRGKQVWVDVRYIPGGADWRERIRRGIEACKAFMFIVSPDSVASEACRDELQAATELHKLVIPVVCRDPPPGTLPGPLADAEWVLLREHDDWADGLGALVDALDADLPWRDQHTRLAARAREWLDAERDSSFLLRGRDLKAAEAWLADQQGHRLTPTREQTEYVARSRQAAARRQRTSFAGLGVGLLVAIGLAVFALIQRQSAIDETHRTQSELLATQAVGNEDVALASLQALEAWRLAPTVDARSAILTVAGSHQIGAPLTGHTDVVTDVAFSPGGGTLASVSHHGSIRLWDIASHRQLGVLKADADTIAFSPDGSALVSAGSRLLVWDVTRRKLAETLPDYGYLTPWRAVAFSADGRTVAAADDGSAIELWDVASRHHIATFSRHQDLVLALAFSRDGRTLASGGLDKTVRLWSIAGRRELGPPVNVQEAVNSVAFSPDGKTLASGDQNGTIRFLDVRRHAQLAVRRMGFLDAVNDVAYSLDGKYLASASQDSAIRLWDAGTHTQVGGALTGHTGSVTAVAFSPGAQMLASGGQDETVRLWQVSSGRQFGSPLGTGDSPIASVAFSPDGKEIAGGGNDHTVHFWDVVSGHELTPLRAGRSGAIRNLAFSPDGRTLATAGSDRTVRLWSLASRRQLGPPLVPRGEIAKPFEPSPTDVIKVTFSPDGKLLATDGFDGTVRLWDLAHHREVRRLHGLSFTIAFSPDGELLATGGANDTLRMVHIPSLLADGRPLIGHFDSPDSVAFSPDGKTLVSGGSDRTVRLWSTVSRRQLGFPLLLHGPNIDSVAFSPDGTMVAAGGDDGMIRIWDFATRRQLGPPLTTGSGPVAGVTFSPNGRTLAARMPDGTIRLWTTAPTSFYHRQLCAYIDKSQAKRIWQAAEPTIPFSQPC